MFAGTYAPVNYAFCNGQLLAVSQNEALFSLLGTAYGGDGRTNFALPDFRGRIPIHKGQGPGLPNYLLGARFGTETVTLTEEQIPAHNHPMQASTQVATSDLVNNRILAKSSGFNFYSTVTDSSKVKPFANEATESVGGDDWHDNMMPTECIHFIICTKGTYPSRN